MLKGFKNAAELDFSLEENKKKMEEAFQQIDAEKGSVYPLIIGGERIETEKKIVSLDPSNKEVLGYACSCSQELAEKANISLSFLGHIERGTRKLSVESLYKLADALGCSVDSLLGFINKERELKYSEILRIIAEDYDRMGK